MIKENRVEGAISRQRTPAKGSYFVFLLDPELHTISLEPRCLLGAGRASVEIWAVQIGSHSECSPGTENNLTTTGRSI